MLIWYGRILQDIDQAQRLVVNVNNGVVSRTAVIIDFDNVGNARDIQEIFERTRKVLLEQYGRPSEFFEQGDVGASLNTDLASNRFIRVMEWKN